MGKAATQRGHFVMSPRMTYMVEFVSGDAKLFAAGEEEGIR
ncbi:hypothetical protein BRCON_2129 [Candidatus Sumerlaea chitinivorans]|uniref:Uncharacterized protein n=1 Tax=Sumerlaea chitinivorans TaxID=2250252 RepID=A0A2Z4Y7A6_SUMC1|nr:hypothetical protein BRCON_2129 [Candidatus Sumerlaea chitinivorans]